MGDQKTILVKILSGLRIEFEKKVRGNIIRETMLKTLSKTANFLPRISRVIPRSFSQSTGFLSRKYSKEHEWITVSDGIGTIGISDYAQDTLGDIVYVELPEVDLEFEIEEEIGVIESVKSVSNIVAPVSGAVIEVNENLEETPDLVNKDPLGEGWIMKVKLSDESELSGLMDEESYTTFCDEQES